MLALHGFTGSGLDFAPIAEALAAHRRIWWIAPDLPGHGLTGFSPSDAPSGLTGMAEVLGRLVAARRLQPIVLGYSMGGRLALTWATADSGRSLEKLILVGATAGIEDAGKRSARHRADLKLARHIREIGSERFAEEWEKSPIIRSQEAIPKRIREPMQERRRRQSAEGLAHCLEIAGTGAMAPVWQALPLIKCPSLALAGQQDTKFTALGRKLAEKIPGGVSGAIPNVGHCAHLENLENFASEFLRFGFAKSRYGT